MMDNLLMWVQAHLEGKLGERESRALEARLREDPQAMELFVETCRIDQKLRDCLPGEEAHRQTEELLTSVKADCQSPRSAGMLHSAGQFFARPTPLSITVAAVFIGMLITAMAFIAAPIYQHVTNRDQKSNDQKESDLTIVAQVTGLQNARWAAGQIGIHPGAHLPSGHRIDLLSGLVEITYGNGTKISLQGPVEFEVQGQRAGRLHTGMLVADVAEGAHGFTIHTSDVDVVDLGTRFGVAVDANGKVEVHVLQGRVSVRWHDETHSAGARESVELAAGEAIRTADSPPGHWHPARHPSQAFAQLAIAFDEAKNPNLQPVASSFSKGADGWSVSFDGILDYNTEQQFLTSRDRGELTSDGQAAYFRFVAPQRFLSDQSRQYGRLLKFDVRLRYVGTDDYAWKIVPGHSVVMRGANITIAAPLHEPRSIGEWTTLEIPLSPAGGWRVLDAPQARLATALEIRRVLSDLHELHILGEYINGHDESDLDNVILGAKR